MRLFLLIILVLSTHCGAASLQIHPATDRLNLSSHVRYIEDQNNTLNFDALQTISQEDWNTISSTHFSKGYSQSSWWLKITTYNALPQAEERLLEIGYPELDHISVYIQTEQGLIVHHMGDALAFDQRPIKGRNFIVPIVFEPNTKLDMYVKVQSSSSLQVPLTLWMPPHYFNHDRTETLVQGFYFGVMIVMGIYNLFVYLAVREKNFLYYVCFVFSMPFFLANLKGFSFEYLWPDHPHWTNPAMIWSLGLCILFGGLFTNSFLKLHQLGNWSIRLFQALQALIGSILISSMFLPYQTVILMLIPVSALACALGLIFGILRWQEGGLPARYYTLGWSAFLLGGIALGLNKLNILPANVLTENTLQFGSSIEVIFLSFALAESINEDRKLRSEAQQEALIAERKVRQAKEEALHIQRQTTEELEVRVQQRTQELEKLNYKLAELSDTDQLTGLKNRRYLDRVLQEEVTRCSRYTHHLSLLLIDIDHFKQFNDLYGHLIGDDCLKMVATTIAQGVRKPTDCATRFGGEEFCLMLPETDSAGADEVAERLRHQVENMAFSVRNQHVPVTASIGIATLLPNEVLTTDELIEKADKALYQSKKEGRNRVTVYQGSFKQAINQLQLKDGSQN